MMRGVPKREVPELLSATTVSLSLFIPKHTLRHNSANKLFDALTTEQPVAVNQEGRIADLVESESCGLRLGAAPAHSAQRLERYLLDASELVDAGPRARQLGARRFVRYLLVQQLEGVRVRAVA